MKRILSLHINVFFFSASEQYQLGGRAKLISISLGKAHEDRADSVSMKVSKKKEPHKGLKRL
jgi:hypothetical protein